VVFYVTKPITKEFYVNSTIGSNTNTGTKANPWKTITHALNQVNPSSLSQAVIIHVAKGTYADSVNGETFPLELKPFVYLRGENRSNHNPRRREKEAPCDFVLEKRKNREPRICVQHRGRLHDQGRLC